MQDNSSALENSRRARNADFKTLWASLLTTRADLPLGAALLVILWLYLTLIFTDSVPWFGYAVLGVLWLAYGILSGRLTYATPLDVPILVLLALLPLSLAISIDKAVSLPKIHGLLLGIIIYTWIVNFLRSYRRLALVIIALVILALGLGILGLVGMDWSTSGLSLLAPLYDHLPNLVQAVPRQVDAGIHVNTIGGALAFFIPLLVSLAWDGGAFHRAFLHRKRRKASLRIAYKALVFLGLAMAFLALILTFSRGAYLGTALGLFALAVWKDRRFLWLIPIGLVAFGLIFFVINDGSPTQLISTLDAGNESSLGMRLTYWRDTLVMIQDFPLTGAGIAAYSQVFEDLYFYNIFSYQGMSYLHAHNTYLAIAVDLGLPALTAYSALLAGFVGMINARYKMGRSVLCTLLRGLVCGLLAHHIFGLTDAFEPGTKLGAILWIFLGIGAAVYVHREGFHWKNADRPVAPAVKPDGALVKRRLIDLSIGLGAWLLISLAAASFVNLSALLSVLLSIIGGIFLGMFLNKRYSAGSL